MKKYFEVPSVDIITIKETDVIVTSIGTINGVQGSSDNEGGFSSGG